MDGTDRRMIPVDRDFFDRDTCEVARDLLGKVLRHHLDGQWLAAQLIETEAYYLAEKGSHASLGWTPKRNALFQAPGTIYMYYAHGGDSFNFSCQGEGNAVLLKSAVIFPFFPDDLTSQTMVQTMQHRNRIAGRIRDSKRLCSGQTLLCRSLGLTVPDWDQQQLIADRLELLDTGYRPEQVLQTTRLGIPAGRDEQLPYRFIDAGFANYCTRNPLRVRKSPPVVRILSTSDSIACPHA